MALVAVPKILYEKLTDEGVEALIELINKSNEKAKEDVISTCGEKFERRLSEEGARIDTRIAEAAAKLDKRITDEVAKLSTQMAEMKADLIRWMFIFWIGQFTSIVGVLSVILFAFFKK